MDAKNISAVEWFYRELFMPHPIEDLGTVLAKANEMFKEQIIDAYKEGYDEGLQIITKYENVEEYYTVTYGK